MKRSWAGLVVVALIVSGCGDADTAVTSTSLESTVVSESTEGCAHVVAAELISAGATYRATATVRSDDTGWDKYADAWEVRTLDGEVLGTRVLLHPHENEQPFTRSLDGLAIPEGVTEVEFAARDSVLGFCGDTFRVRVPV